MGGPQFRQAFTNFCKLHGISHELASAYNPESNKLAKAAVKSMKALVMRTKKMGESLRQAIVCWRNMKRQNGSSPAELFWEITQRHRMPTPQYTPPASDYPARRDGLHRKQINARNKHTATFLPLQLGDTALLADSTTGKRTKEVTIVAINTSGRSYQVQDSQGRTHTRSRELPRKRIKRPVLETPLEPRQFKEKEGKEETKQKDAKLQLRKSARIRCSLEDKRAKHDEATA